jgi:hypothetical protein
MLADADAFASHAQRLERAAHFFQKDASSFLAATGSFLLESPYPRAWAQPGPYDTARPARPRVPERHAALFTTELHSRLAEVHSGGWARGGAPTGWLRAGLPARHSVWSLGRRRCVDGPHPGLKCSFSARNNLRARHSFPSSILSLCVWKGGMGGGVGVREALMRTCAAALHAPTCRLYRPRPPPLAAERTAHRVCRRRVRHSQAHCRVACRLRERQGVQYCVAGFAGGRGELANIMGRAAWLSDKIGLTPSLGACGPTADKCCWGCRAGAINHQKGKSVKPSAARRAVGHAGLPAS